MSARYKEIILHAGLGKTGTTSIQNNCYRLREFLAERNIVYPGFWLKGRLLTNHSDAITGALCARAASYGFGFRHQVGSESEADTLRLELREQLLPLLQEPAGETLILSGESVAEYEPKDLRRVEEALTPHTERLRVVAYIRSPQSALESMLQQRVKGGQVRVAEEMLGIVRSRYQRLAKRFGSRLEVINYHDAVRHETGLVGSFLALAGISAEELSDLDFSSSNERISQEAFAIMMAINRSYPLGEQAETGLRRRPNDLASLADLQGQPFRLQGYIDSSVYQSALEESQWLERELNLQFPPLQQQTSEPIWQQATLFALEECIRGLPETQLRQAAVDFLNETAAELQPVEAETAAVLGFLAAKIQEIDTNPIPRHAQQLGPDYFKFAALQVEGANTSMALQLMEIARALNPGGAQINQRTAMYTERLEAEKQRDS